MRRKRISRDEPIEPGKLNSYQRFYDWVVHLTMLTTCVDQCRIYKMAHFYRRPPARYRLYTRDSVAIAPDAEDNKFRRRLRLGQLLLLSYLVLRFTFILLLQLALYYDKQSSQLNAVSDLFGNPLRNMQAESVVIYTSILIGLINMLGFFPHLTLKRPLDAASLRFLLAPQRELRRIDRAIWEQLEALASDVRRCQQLATRAQHQDYYFRPALGGLGPHEQVFLRGRLPAITATSGRQLAERPLELIRRRKLALWRLRPAIYTNHWYQDLHFQLPFQSVAISTTLIAIEIALTLLVIWVSWNRKCRAKGIAPAGCALTEAFTPQELWAFFDLLLGATCIAFTGYLVFITITFSVRGQLLLADDVRDELCELVDDLRLANHRISLPTSDEWRLENRMLGALVTYRLSQREVCRTSANMSLMLELYLTFVGSTILVALMASSMRANQVSWLILVGTLPLWTTTNLSLLACALFHAHTNKTSRQSWSLLAQIITWCHQRDRLILDDAVASGWFRLAQQQHRLSNRWDAVRTFGSSITFSKILEVNFFALSVFALLRSLVT